MLKNIFIIGGDSLEWIDKWVEADELFKRDVVLSAVRGETDKDRSLKSLKISNPDTRKLISGFLI